MRTPLRCHRRRAPIQAQGVRRASRAPRADGTRPAVEAQAGDEEPSAAAESPMARPPRRRPISALVVAAILTCVGALTLAAGVAAQRVTPVDTVLGGNEPINPGAGDPRVLAADNSPTSAQDPTDASELAIAYRVDIPQYSCGLSVSLDGGATWVARSIPFPAGEDLPPRCFAPDVVFGSDGTLYLAFVTLVGAGNSPHAVWLTRSHDAGKTLSTPVRVEGPLAFQVNLAADPSAPGHLYLTWLQAAATSNLGFPVTGYPILLSRSDDGGDHWSAPVAVSSPARQEVVAPSIALAPGGPLYVLYLDMGNDRLDYTGATGGRGGPPYAGHWSLVLARSSDRGVTWREAVVEPNLVPTRRFVVYLPPTPSLAVDPTRGRVYVAFEDARLGDPDVWVWTAPAGGAQFGQPVRVNDTPEHDGTFQYLPRLAVSPSGRVDVLYYDRRADRANIFDEVSLQSSWDQGSTFSPRLRVSDHRFSSHIGFGGELGLADLGSRLGLIADDRGDVAVWTDTRSGTEDTSKQDIAAEIVAVSDPSHWWVRPLIVGGSVLAALSLMLAVWWGLGGPWRTRTRQDDAQAATAPVASSEASTRATPGSPWAE